MLNSDSNNNSVEVIGGEKTINDLHYELLTLRRELNQNKARDDDKSALQNQLQNQTMQIQQLNADHNTYSSTKSVGQQFLNTAVITNYIQLFIAILGRTPLTLTSFDISAIVVICVAISIQALIFVLVSVLYAAKSENVTKNCTATSLNNFVTLLTFITTILNIVITALSSKIYTQNFSSVSTNNNTTL